MRTHSGGVQPLLQEVGPSSGGGGGGVQGLDWFRGALLRDSDGDCAHEFLEESRRHVADDSPPHKQPRPAAMLQSQTKAAAPARLRSPMTVERGNVLLAAETQRDLERDRK